MVTIELDKNELKDI